MLQEGTAGDPMRAEVKWTYLTGQEIASRRAARGLPGSTAVVHQLLKEHGYVRRKAPEEPGDQAVSRTPCPVRKHRPTAGGISGRRQSHPQYRYEEERTLGQFLPGRKRLLHRGPAGPRPRCQPVCRGEPLLHSEPPPDDLQNALGPRKPTTRARFTTRWIMREPNRCQRPFSALLLQPPHVLLQDAQLLLLSLRLGFQSSNRLRVVATTCDTSRLSLPGCAKRNGPPPTRVI